MNNVLKVVLGVVLVGVGAIVMLAVAGVIIARNLHVKETGSGENKTVVISSPFGKMAVHANKDLDPEQVGVPIYPGASRAAEKGGADFEIDSGDLHRDLTVTGATYYTTDSVDQVREFYQNKFPDWKSHWNNDEWKLETTHDGQIRSVSIKRDGDRTRIGVASVGAPAAN